MLDKIGCWFGRHDHTYWTVNQARMRGCNRCGRKWLRCRYDMHVVWVRVPGVEG